MPELARDGLGREHDQMVPRPRGADVEVATQFLFVLVPELRRQPSTAQAAGAWNVESSRVVTAEDKLTALEQSAPDQAAGTRARTLRDAVRAARGDIENLLASATPLTMPPDLDAVAARLEQALGQPRPEAATPPGPPGPR